MYIQEVYGCYSVVLGRERFVAGGYQRSSMGFPAGTIQSLQGKKGKPKRTYRNPAPVDS